MTTSSLRLALMAVLVVAGVVSADESSPATSTSVSWEQVTSRGRIVAEKAAQEDALKKLEETIRGLQFGPQRLGGAKQFVSDFAGDYEQVSAAIGELVGNVQPATETKYLSDLICEVEVEVKTEDVVKLLETHRQMIIKDLQNDLTANREQLRKLLGYNFNYINTYYQSGGKPLRTIDVVGIGKPPEQYIRRSKVTSQTISPIMAVPPSWATRVITVKARGEPAEELSAELARTSAEHAAIFAAQYEAFLKIQAIRLDEKTTLGDVLTANHKVYNLLMSFIATTEGKTTTQPDGSVEVVLRLPLEKFYESAKHLLPAPGSQ